VHKTGKDEPSSGSGKRAELKEAMLVIRGTVSTMDWTINLDEDTVPYTYYASGEGVGGSGGNRRNDGDRDDVGDKGRQELLMRGIIIILLFCSIAMSAISYATSLIV
jgi:hypothetical protein